MQRGVIDRSNRSSPKFVVTSLFRRKPIYSGISKEEVKNVTGFNDNITKRNIAFLHTCIYSALFGGRPKSFFKSDVSRDLAGEFYFRPDVIKADADGRHYTEVKSWTPQRAKASCKINQIGYYFDALARRIESGDRAPQIYYAFFNYGHRMDWPFNKYSPKKLLAEGSDTIKSLVVLPANAALLAFMLSSNTTLNQSSSRASNPNSQYKEVGSSILSAFSSRGANPEMQSAGMSVLDQVFQDYFARIQKFYHSNKGRNGKGSIDNSWLNYVENRLATTKDFAENNLGLENLCVDRFDSPKGLNYDYFGKHYVNQFPVTVFSTPRSDYKSWLNHYSESREKILGRTKIPDFYKDLPF